MNTIKIAFIGAGYMAQEHAKAFAGMPGVELSGVCSRTPARAEALAAQYAMEVFDSVDALYQGTSADIVVVAVPELAVAAVCCEVFRYPWLSLIEKPVGYNLAEAQEVAAQAKQLGRRAYVGLNRRHYSSTRAVLAQLASIDEPRLVHVLDQENPREALAGGQPPLVVENWMYANSIHIVDYLAVFCRGAVDSVERVIPWTPTEPRFVLTKFNFSSGDIGLYQAVWNAPGPWAVSVATQAKRWEMRPLEQASVQVYKSRRAEPLDVDPRDTQFKPGLRLQAEETLRALRGEPNRLPTLEDGLATMELVRGIYEA